VLGLAGDPQRGGEVFRGTAQCSRCHAETRGAPSFGPSLAGIGRKYTRAQLLDQIRFPSQIIAPEYKTTIITLNDGDEVSGFVVHRDAAEVSLRNETLAERRIKLSDVQSTRETTLSAMPEGLLAPLTAQEAADILEFLFRSQ
jgi:putative heme-binding domain-containing protein